MDLDPQGNASTGLGLERDQRDITSYDVLSGDQGLDVAVQPTAIPNLFIVPSTVDLSGAELELAASERRGQRLKEAFQTSKALDEFDYILIDCPPSLGILTLNALIAAQSVLVPLQCEFFALEGLSQLLTTVERIRTNFNPSLKIHGVVLTMFDLSLIHI